MTETPLPASPYMFTDPSQNITQFQLLPGQNVADFGSGSGFYALAAARVVGPSGKVYAVDVQKELLARLKNEATKAHLYNVEAVWGDLEHPGGTHLPDHSVDAVIVSNILFQLEHRDAFMAELLRVLKRPGRALVIDWSDEYSGMGPPAEHLFPEKDARALFEQHGFAIERGIAAGDSHYGFTCRLS